ncbi:MAG: hypothetical protein ABJM43_02715 [Paracoccaceae bacterium]
MHKTEALAEMLEGLIVHAVKLGRYGLASDLQNVVKTFEDEKIERSRKAKLIEILGDTKQMPTITIDVSVHKREKLDRLQ